MNEWIKMLIIVFAMVLLGLMFQNYQKSNIQVQAIKNGLEECPNILSNFQRDTIWVKNCNNFLKKNEKNEKNEKEKK